MVRTEVTLFPSLVSVIVRSLVLVRGTFGDDALVQVRFGEGTPNTAQVSTDTSV